MMNFAKYLSVIAISMLKFAGGPLTGLATKLSWIETVLCSVIGMMLTVSLVVFSGEFFGRIFRKKKSKKFTKMARIAVKIRQRFGLAGIAFLTPILFTPPLGAALSIAFRYNKKAIFIQMLISAVGWGIVQTLFFYFIKELIFK
jgi:uncharacterized membrane protein